MSDIPILDLGPEIEAHYDEYMDAISGVLKSKQFILGPEVEAFEEEAADYLGVAHAIGVNSGTDAIVIALRGLGIGPGDEVICPSFTFFATAEGISQVGATPVFADIEPDTMNMDPKSVEVLVTDRTKAIMPVHLFGHPADMDALMAIAKEHDLSVIEDCAQSWGATFDGKQTGSIGHAAAFSFFPSKNLGAFGDGGLIATNDGAVDGESRKLRFHGCKVKYQNEALGYNSRLDALQAAVLRIKLRNIDAWNDGRRAAAERYARLLADIDGLTIPMERDGCRHVYHQYTVRIADGRRDAVQAALKDAGIQTMVYYPNPVHRLPVYGMEQALPETDKAATEVLSLPIGPFLGTEDQERVAEAIRSALG